MQLASFYTDEYLCSFAQEIDLPQGAFDALMRQKSQMTQEEVFKICEKILDPQMTLAEKNEVIETLRLENEGDLKCMFVYLVASGGLWALYQKKGIPREIWLDTLKSITEKMITYYDAEGRWGASSYAWPLNGISMRIFRLERLAFQINFHDGEPEIYGGKTYIDRGDCYIAIHIPDRDAFDHELCVKSYEKARWFFKTFYPELQIRYFRCQSWLLFDELKNMLKEDSNILKFQRDFEIAEQIPRPPRDVLIRLFGRDSADLGVFEAKTSLQKKMLDFLKNGGVNCAGRGYIKF